MSGFLDRVAACLVAGEDWAVPVVFAISFVESPPGASLVVHSTTLLLATGASIGAGTLEPGPVLVAAIAGAMICDAVGFWLSRAYGSQIVRRWLPRRQRPPYARTLLLFRLWGWPAVDERRSVSPSPRQRRPGLAAGDLRPDRRLRSRQVCHTAIARPLFQQPDPARQRYRSRSIREFPAYPQSCFLGRSPAGECVTHASGGDGKG